MSVKLRLQRTGAPKKPFYRLVAVDKNKKRNSDALENLGYYNPLSNDIKINSDRYKYWLTCGAQPTNIVSFLWKKFKRNTETVTSTKLN